MCFQIVRVQVASSREKTMHTVLSADDPGKVAHLVCHVRMMARWDPDRDVEGLQVHYEGDGEWLKPCRLAPFDDFVHRCTVYNRVDHVPDSPGVLVLSDAHRARPPYALDADRVPTLMLANQLIKTKWMSMQYTVRHDRIPLQDTPPCEFDSREAVRMKYYYMCVVQLERVLPLAGGVMPSQEPIMYYRLLLRGERVDAGQSSKHLTLQWNRDKKTKAKDILPLPPPEVVPPLQDLGDEDFDAHPAGWQVAKAQARRGGQGPRGRGGPGRGRGTGRGDGDGGAAPGPAPAPLPIVAAPPAVDADVVDFDPPPPALEGRKRKREEGPAWRDALDGMQVRLFSSYTNTNTGIDEPHWKAKCKFHADCEKRRGIIPRFKKHHGEIEPLAFCHAWHLMETPSKPGIPTHSRDNPSQAAVDAYIAAHASELPRSCTIGLRSL